ncbi:MAG: ribosome biogenesis GTP-binding protein YihA/YsxC [Acholeplasmataceae bacterium]|nr:ribosome biogenesis GTP-binding protein YihA/YsxC [Acholeplasmataceae bacterium]
MIKEAMYIKSLTDLKDRPEVFPQILLLGRSNVGKSSFINSLTNRKNLARVSKTPGKTLLLNFYLLNQNFYLVDAPGYGYARRSKSLKDEFIIMIEKFLLNNQDLLFVCLLIDFKVGPTKDDINTYNFIRQLGREVVVIATKKDKIPKTKQYKQEKLIKSMLGTPELFISVSNVTKENIKTVESLFLERIENYYHEKEVYEEI